MLYDFKISSIGIDIESISRKVNILKIAKRYYHNSEYEWLIKTKQPEYNAMQLWIRKEAYVKLSGSSLAREMSKAIFDKEFKFIDANVKFLSWEYKDLIIACATINPNVAIEFWD